MEFRQDEINSHRTLSAITSLQEAGWLLLLVLVPLIVNLWIQRPFELPKVAVLQTLVWLLAGLALAEALLARRARLPGNNILWGSVGLLAFLLAMSTVTAAELSLSLWGSFHRGQGVVTWLTYLLLFFLAARHFRHPDRARPVILAMAATAGPIILLSLAQAAGRDPFGLVIDARSPIYATLGRANFVGAYLAILAPLTLFLLLRSIRLRWVWAALLAGELLIIGLSQARGAWLAAAVALAVFAGLWWGNRWRRIWRLLAWAGVGMLFLAGPLAVLGLGPGDSGSLAARLRIWQGTLKLIAQRPLTGYGADALGMIFPGVFPPDLVYLQGREFFVDRAHNLLLDWLVIAGVPGLITFIFLLVVWLLFIIQGLRRAPSPARRGLLVAILAAVLGNLAHTLVSFDVTATATATWLLMGMGVALATPAAQQPEAVTGRRVWRRWVVIGLVGFGIALAIWQVNARPFLADLAARSAQKHARTGQWDQALADAQRAAANWPTEPSHRLLLSQIYWQRAAAEPATASLWLPKAEETLLAARELRPGEMSTWLQMALFYQASARQFGTDTFGLAEAAYRQAVVLAPNQAGIYAAWGRMHLQLYAPEKAAPLLRKAVALDSSDGQALLSLAAAELALGRTEIALADYRETVRLLPESSAAYSGLAASLWQLGREKEAARALQLALALDSGNSQAIHLTKFIPDP